MSQNVATYLAEVSDKYKTGRAGEHAYRPTFEKLIRSIDPKLSVINDPKRTEHGAPDFVFVRGDLTAGYAVSCIPGISKIIDWFDRIEEAEHKKKIELLLKKYALNFNDINEALNKLRFLTSMPGGQTLFRKIIQILNSGDQDEEWIGLLAKVLKNLTNSSIEKVFEEHSFLIAIIDKISPYSLILLSKFDIWKEAEVQGTTTTSSHTLSGNWDIQVAGYFARATRITDSDTILRIKYTFRDLESSGLVVLSGHRLGCSSMGYKIYKLIIS